MKIIDSYLPEFEKAIEHFKKEIAGLKTGRANPAILDSVFVEAYDSKVPISQVGSISVPEARCIIIQPWDKSIVKQIEKAISEANLGLSVANEGERLRVVVPQMTEESRKDIVKLLSQRTEQARVSVRGTRDEAKEAIMTAEKNKEFGEDERYNLTENLDEVTRGYTEQIKQIADQKEEEIMTI
ncbi:MAG: ribosome recycling factor [bacterium]